MPKVVLVGLSLVAFVLVSWAGGEPWKDKPFQQWDEKDVNRVLNDSPWVKVIHVEASWRGSGQAVQEAGNNSGSNSSRPSMRGMGGGGYGSRGAGGGEDEGESNPRLTMSMAPFLIRWTSSRAIREAILRDSLLKGKIHEADVEKAMAMPIEEYTVMVGGPDMTPFATADEAGLRAQAYLSTKKSKQKILPDKVEILRTEDGKTVTAVVFYFPKKATNGEAEIAPDEKGLEFALAYGQLKLKANFDPSKMSDQLGKDL